jgi:hypothetical protein
MVGASASGYAIAARRAAQSAASRVYAATIEFLVAFGSRFSVFIAPIQVDQLESMSGKKGA